MGVRGSPANKKDMKAAIDTLRECIARLESSAEGDRDSSNTLSEIQPLIQALEQKLSGGPSNHNGTQPQDSPQKSEQQLLLEQERTLFQAIFDIDPGGIAVMAGPELTYQFVNPSYRKITPFPEIDPIGHPYAEIWPQQEGFQIVPLFKRVLERGEDFHTQRHKRRYPDGTFRYFSFHLHPITWNGAPAVLSVLWDTSALVLAQQTAELVAEEARRNLVDLEAVMDAVPAYLWISHDSECRVMVGNRASYELVGMKPGANLSKTASEGVVPGRFFALSDGREIPLDELPMQIAASQGKYLRDCEFELAFEDGSHYYLAGNATPLLNSSGKPAGAVGAFIDVTRRKQVEDELRGAKEQLEQRVKERTAELELTTAELEATAIKLETINNQLRQEADENLHYSLALAQSEARLKQALKEEQAMRAQLILSEKYAALARLVASVAHELNNPIQTIQNCMFLLKDSHVVPEGPQTQFMDMAITESKRIARLVAQLRETYRPPKSNHAEVFNVLEVLDGVSNIIEPHLQQNHTEMKIIADQNPILISGISDQIKQVFLNICLNAIEAMQPQGGHIWVHASVMNKGKQISITFQDSGPGIPPENMSRLFEPFFTTKEKGTGLGLSICYEIVQSHGGKITVKSRPGKGAAFTIWLPVDQP